MPDVQGHCPACGGKSLFLGEGGHVTCSRADCPAPDAADDMLGEGAPMLHRVAVLASKLFTTGVPGIERETARKFLAALQRKEPRLLGCGFCYEEQGEEVHPHPECPVGAVDRPVVEKNVRLEGALHVLRYALDRFIQIGYNPAPEFLRDLVDKVTDNPGEPCDRDQQYARAEAAEAEVQRLRVGQCEGDGEILRLTGERDELHAEIGLAHGQLHSAALSSIRGKHANIRELIERTEQAESERDEARSWARHGYEIGQKHCSWSDHGVAPAWLTEGWPPHIDSCEHLKHAADLEEAEAVRKRVAKECRAVLADALGVDRLRDWDDIRNAAAGLRKERDAQGEALERVRAESARIRSITPTWAPVADLIDAALDDPGRPREQRMRPAHADGTPYSYYEIVAEGWGFCDGCGLWSTASPARPHECSEAHMKGPVVGTARIALDATADITDGADSKQLTDGVILPAISFESAGILPLRQTGSEPERLLLAGDEQSRFTVDGRQYAVSSEHPVLVEAFGPGAKGGLVTLTLIADSVTVNGKEVGE